MSAATAIPIFNGVLVVDDDDDIRNDLAEMLREEGFAVETAADGEEALRRLRAGSRPRLILLDLMMPKMNGWDFRAEQRRDPLLAAIPVAIISGVPKPNDGGAFLDTVAWLRKPFDLDLLMATIQSHC